MKRKRILSLKKKLARETEKDVQPKALKVRRNLWSLCYMTLLSLFFVVVLPFKYIWLATWGKTILTFYFPFKLQVFVLGQVIIIISSSGLLKNLLIPSNMVKACFFLFRWYQRMKKKNNIFIHVELP